MTSVAFVDTNIPIYAAGREHRHKRSCSRVIRTIADSPARYFSSAEVLQELMHHYLRTHRWALGREVFRRFEIVLQGRIEPVFPEDVSQASRMVDLGVGVSSRDLVHVSVMRRMGTSLVVSMDSDFDRIPGVQRLDPGQLDQWQF